MPNQFNTSLWGDEAFSAILSMKSIPEIIKIITHDTSPPLYNITEHIWFQIFGTSEVAIRSLSFLYFLLAIFFTYKIGSLLFNKKTGFLAATLTFLNPFFFTYAFEGRMYSILALGVTASMYFFLKQNWFFYVLATAWALYSHHFAIFAIFVQGLWFLKELATNREKKIPLYMFLSFLAVAILYVSWLIPLYNQTKMVGGGFWLGTPTIKDLITLIAEYLAKGIKHSLTTPALALVLIVLILRKWHKSIEKTLFLLFWFLLPILGTFVISQKFQSIFFNRYLLYTIPAAMLIVASNTRRVLSYIFILGLLVLLAQVDYHYFTHPTKRPFREMAEYVKETKRGDDILINWNAAAHHLWESKYYGIPAPIYLPDEQSLPFFVGTALMTEEDIIRKIPQKLPDKVKLQKVGVITSGSVDEISLPNYTEKEVKVFGELKFIWLSKKL